jgi:hypothetical protein
MIIASPILSSPVAGAGPVTVPKATLPALTLPSGIAARQILPPPAISSATNVGAVASPAQSTSSGSVTVPVSSLTSGTGAGAPTSPTQIARGTVTLSVVVPKSAYQSMVNYLNSLSSTPLTGNDLNTQINALLTQAMLNPSVFFWGS